MVAIIGTGSKSTHVTIIHRRTHEYDCLDCNSRSFHKGPTSLQPERAEDWKSIESVMEIDGVRISADSIKQYGNNSKLTGFTSTCITTCIEATFSFIYKSDVFPVDRDLKFYWPMEVHVDGDGRRWVKHDLLSFTSEIRIYERDEQTKWT